MLLVAKILVTKILVAKILSSQVLPGHAPCGKPQYCPIKLPLPIPTITINTQKYCYQYPPIKNTFIAKVIPGHAPGGKPQYCRRHSAQHDAVELVSSTCTNLLLFFSNLKRVKGGFTRKRHLGETLQSESTPTKTMGQSFGGSIEPFDWISPHILYLFDRTKRGDTRGLGWIFRVG